MNPCVIHAKCKFYIIFFRQIQRFFIATNKWNSSVPRNKFVQMMHHHTLKLFACNWSQLKLIARIFLIALLLIKLIVNLLPEFVTGVLYIRTSNGNRWAPCPMLSSVKYTHFVQVSSKQKHIFSSDLTNGVISRALQSNNRLFAWNYFAFACSHARVSPRCGNKVGVL